MNKSVEIIPAEAVEKETVLLTPKDQRDWDRVLAVRAAFQEGATNIKAACEKANVSRQVFYDSIKNPLIQEAILSEMRGLDAIASEVLSTWWVRVLVNMSNIATSGDSKEAVQAARFLRDVKMDLERDSQSSGVGGSSDARRIIDAVMGHQGKRLKLRQVTQEIEVEDGEIVVNVQ